MQCPRFGSEEKFNTSCTAMLQLDQHEVADARRSPDHHQDSKLNALAGMIVAARLG